MVVKEREEEAETETETETEIEIEIETETIEWYILRITKYEQKFQGQLDQLGYRGAVWIDYQGTSC